MATSLKQNSNLNEKDVISLITSDNPKLITLLLPSLQNHLLLKLSTFSIPLITHLIKSNTINILTALFNKYPQILINLHIPSTHSNLLHIAIEEHKCLIIKLITSFFQLINYTKDNQGNTELHKWVTYHSNCDKCFRLLSAVGTELNSYMISGNLKGINALELALSYGNEAVCLLLMKAFKFDYGHCDKNKETILHKIARSNLIGIVEMVEYRNILQCISVFNETCLTIALGKGNYVLAELFIDKGIQVTKEDKTIADCVSDIPFSLAKKIRMKKIGVSNINSLSSSNGHKESISIPMSRSASLTQPHLMVNGFKHKDKDKDGDDSHRKVSKFSIRKVKDNNINSMNITGKSLNMNGSMKCLSLTQKKNSESSIAMLTTSSIERNNNNNAQNCDTLPKTKTIPKTKTMLNTSTTKMVNMSPQKQYNYIKNFTQVTDKNKNNSSNKSNHSQILNISNTMCSSSTSRLINTAFNYNNNVINSAKRKTLHKTYTNLTSCTLPNRNQSQDHRHIEKNNSYHASISNTVTHSYKQYLTFNYIQSFHIIPYKDIIINTTDILHLADHCTIYKGKYLSLPVAIKVFPMDKMSQSELQSFNSEIMLHINLRHPSIVPFVGYSIKDNHFLLLTEFMENYNLKIVLENSIIPLSQSDKLRIINQIAIGVLYLHKRNPLVLHRDLKSSNVLMDKYYNAKLCDFGISKALNGESNRDEGESAMKTNCQSTPYWMAPEFIIEGRFDEKSDVYSFGILMWEIVMRDTLPYKNRNQFDFILGNKESLKQRPIINEENMAMDKKCYQMVKALMEKCWNEKPAVRPTMEEVLKKIEEIIIKIKD